MPHALHARQAQRELGGCADAEGNLCVSGLRQHTWPVLVSGLPAALAWEALMWAATPSIRPFQGTGGSAWLMGMPCQLLQVWLPA